MVFSIGVPACAKRCPSSGVKLVHRAVSAVGMSTCPMQLAQPNDGTNTLQRHDGVALNS